MMTGVLVELAADREKKAMQRDVVRYLWVADSAEVDCMEGSEQLDAVVGLVEPDSIEV